MPQKAVSDQGLHSFALSTEISVINDKLNQSTESTGGSIVSEYRLGTWS